MSPDCHHHGGMDSGLHAELHREADGLGKYALELEIHSEEGLPKQTVRDFTDELLRASASECFARGADLIGHIKAFVKVGDQSLLFSMVDDRIPVKVQDHLPCDTIRDAELVLHVIVHGIWDDTVRECTLKVLPELAGKWRVPYTVKADHRSGAEHPHC